MEARFWGADEENLVEVRLKEDTYKCVVNNVRAKRELK